MPVAMVIPMTAESEGHIYGATGRHAHGFWLNTWRAIDPAAGDALHDERRLRPFALSPLMGLPLPRQGRTRVVAGARSWLRVCALDATAEGLLEAWRARAPERAEVGGVVWRLGAAVVDGHPAAGRATFAALRDRGAVDRPRRWSLRFESPTAVHQRDDSYLPFPLPVPLVLGWLDRWRECSDVALPDLSIDRLGAGLRISSYELRTVSARFWQQDATGRRREWPQIGCVGRLSLDAGPLSAVERGALAALVGFAFFCGSGHHTTMGMGQTREVGNEG